MGANNNTFSNTSRFLSRRFLASVFFFYSFLTVLAVKNKTFRLELALALFMAGITAHDINNALPADDFAMIANPFHAGTYFHSSNL